MKLRVADANDVAQARRVARDLATSLGFGHEDAEMVALAASELGTNLVRYARDGTLEVDRVERDGRAGVELASCDEGPGIGNVPQALRDGFSTGGGLGSGLGSVQRLMDDFEIGSSPAGTRVVARRWLRRDPRAAAR